MARPVMKRKTILNVKLNEAEVGYVKCMAGLYAGGNLSLWIRHCLMNNTPAMLIKEKGPKAAPPKGNPENGSIKVGPS